MRQARNVLVRFLAPCLRKSSGEGSRGGKILGHTRSGKPIYQRHSDRKAVAAQYTAQDHHDACDWHEHIGAMHRAVADNALDSADSEHISGALRDHLLATNDRFRQRARRHGKISEWHYQRYKAGVDDQEKADENAWNEMQRRHAQAS